MKVHEIMTAHARCVGPDNSLVEAAGLMREMDVGSLPVCEDDRIAGIITDRDLAVRAVADGRDPTTTLVREVMTPGVVHVFADQEVEAAARTMQEHEVRRLPVLNRSKRLVGIVSLGDMAVSSNPAFSGMTLREVSQPAKPNGRERRRDAMGLAAGAGRQMQPASGGRDGGEAEAPAPRRTTKRATGATRSTGGRRTGSRRPRQRQKKTTRAAGGGTGKRARGGSPRRKSSSRAAG